MTSLYCRGVPPFQLRGTTISMALAPAIDEPVTCDTCVDAHLRLSWGQYSISAVVPMPLLQQLFAIVTRDPAVLAASSAWPIALSVSMVASLCRLFMRRWSRELGLIGGASIELDDVQVRVRESGSAVPTQRAAGESLACHISVVLTDTAQPHRPVPRYVASAAVPMPLLALLTALLLRLGPAATPQRRVDEAALWATSAKVPLNGNLITGAVRLSSDALRSLRPGDVLLGEPLTRDATPARVFLKLTRHQGVWITRVDEGVMMLDGTALLDVDATMEAISATNDGTGIVPDSHNDSAPHDMDIPVTLFLETACVQLTVGAAARWDAATTLDVVPQPVEARVLVGGKPVARGTAIELCGRHGIQLTGFTLAES